MIFRKKLYSYLPLLVFLIILYIARVLFLGNLFFVFQAPDTACAPQTASQRGQGQS